jgi:hypothetical protein
MNELSFLIGFILFVGILLIIRPPHTIEVHVNQPPPEQSSAAGGGCLPIIVVVLLLVLFVGWLA